MKFAKFSHLLEVQEIHYQKNEEIREAEKVAAEKQRQAIDKAVVQGQLQRLKQTAWQ